jgi:hypothetical protein
LFDVWFRPLYPTDLRHDDAALFAARARDANPGKNPRLYGELFEVAEVFARLAPAALGKQDLVLDYSDASVHRLSEAVDRAARNRLIAASKPGDPDALFSRFVIHGALYLGGCVVKSYDGKWGARHPLWETVVRLESRAGIGDLAPFHWWLKALSDNEIDRGGLATRYRQWVERANPADLPPFITVKTDRKLPTLSKVRYDTLHKYLVAHIPELKDLGRDFPSPEKLDELGFLSLDFVILGEGRMLLMHGRGRNGLHLMWLDHQGFSHAAFFPADPGAPHSVTIEGDKLIAKFEHEHLPITHEMLWWS